ncbi:hypothetical protein BKA69DRAFT_476500 [Paraphysoderma sedebokerense]|nr:hypothetical protein BKA69DRAFT_476500 [Paraphysoderma sedebokerense]
MELSLFLLLLLSFFHVSIQQLTPENQLTCFSFSDSQYCPGFPGAVLPRNLTSILQEHIFQYSRQSPPSPQTFVSSTAEADKIIFESNLIQQKNSILEGRWGCSLEKAPPRWYLTYACISVINSGAKECGVQPMNICQSLMNEYYESISSSLNDLRTCSTIDPRVRSDSLVLVESSKSKDSLAFVKDASTCIDSSKLMNSSEASRCGWNTDGTACRNNCNKLQCNIVATSSEAAVPPWAVALTVCGSVVVVATIVFIIFFWRRDRLKKARKLEAMKSEFADYDDPENENFDLELEENQLTVRSAFSQDNASILSFVVYDPGRHSSLEARKVLHGYIAQLPDELDLQVGDMVVIHAEHADGWCHGQSLSTGQFGAFPNACFIADLTTIAAISENTLNSTFSPTEPSEPTLQSEYPKNSRFQVDAVDDATQTTAPPSPVRSPKEGVVLSEKANDSYEVSSDLRTKLDSVVSRFKSNLIDNKKDKSLSRNVSLRFTYDHSTGSLKRQRKRHSNANDGLIIGDSFKNASGIPSSSETNREIGRESEDSQSTR